MKLTCSKCRYQIEIPPEVLHSPEPRVTCPSCGARFRLKPKTGAPALPHVQTASDLAGQTTPGVRRPHAETVRPAPAQPAQTTAPPPMPLGEAPTRVSTGAGSAVGRSGARHAVLPAFDAGDLVAGRYRIVRFLAQGGMGEVYEAKDEELLQEVALKTVSAAMGDEPAVVERFKREIALARRVTHPNVCRIFDLGTHQPPPTAERPHPEPIAFLTMELLRGETLSSLLKRRERLSAEESVHLVEQMAAALGAAHASNVVHRDFKSENVFLVPEDGSDQVGDPRGARAVITDFGVARGAAGDAFAAQVTGLGIVGTPSYMAPEQVENAPEITAAADIYALGVVLYEMSTGRLPFESDNPLTVAVKRLKEEPKPPHVHAPDLPPVWERTILRCLARRPVDRFPAVEDVPAALAAIPQRRPPTGEPSSRPAPRSPSSQRSKPAPRPTLAQPTATQIAGAASATPEGPPKRTRLLAGVLGLVVILAAALWWLNREVLQERVKIRPAVAVLGLDNTTGRDDAAWIDTAVAEMLANELARSEDLRTISGERVAAARRQVEIDRLAEPGGEALGRLRTLLGSDYVVTGSYVALPGDAGELRVDLRLFDAALGQTVESFTETGAMGDLLTMVSNLGGSLRQSLDAGGAVDGDAGLPSDPEAARLYAEALDDLRDFRAEAARDNLQRALAAEPSNPMLHAALASAWDALGYTDRATEAARAAFDGSGNLPLEDRLLIEARLREAEGDWSAAFEAYRQLFESFPDELDYGLGLVDAQIAGGDADGALTNLERLRLLPEPLNEDPRIDLAEAEAAARLSRLEQQARAAERAATRAETSQASLLLARALLAGAQAERLLGRTESASSAIDRARTLYDTLDHGPGRAEALTAAANLRFDQGQLDDAADGYRQAETVYRDLGDRSGVVASLNNLAVVLKRQGDLDGAEALYRENETIAREVGDERNEVLAINNRAVLLVDRDRLDEARAMFEASLDTWEAVGGSPARAYALNNLAEALRLQGRLDDARALHDEAISIRRQANLQRDLATSLANLGLLQIDAGSLDEARTTLDRAREAVEAAEDPTTRADWLFAFGELHRRADRVDEALDAHREALELRQSLDQSAAIARSQIAVARLLLDRAPTEAEDLARQAWTSSQLDGRPADEARAAAVVLDALIRLDATADTADLFDEIETVAAATTQPTVRIELGLAQARQLYQSGDRRRAMDVLAALDREARSYGLLMLARDIRRTADALGS